MRIAQVAPLYESVPPKGYGGTERVVSCLTEELVRRGHEVTLFAAEDSRTSARLVPGCQGSLRVQGLTREQELACHYVMLERVAREAEQFDLIHFHIDYLHFPVSRREGYPQLTTLHGRLDMPELVPLYREYPDMPLVSISDRQRRPLAWAGFLGTVYHGLPPGQTRANLTPGSYLAFLGRMSPEKRVDQAVAIALRSGYELKIMGKVDRADCEYFQQVVVPLLEAPGVEFLGEGGESEKNDLLRDAAGLLFPIDWPEPFGLVMIEAFALGTPVVAFRRGSVPEVVEEGVTGYAVDSVEEAVQAVSRLGELDRGRIRSVFEQRFSVERMTSDYLALYERLLEREERPLKWASSGGPALLVPPASGARAEGAAAVPR